MGGPQFLSTLNVSFRHRSISARFQRLSHSLPVAGAALEPHSAGDVLAVGKPGEPLSVAIDPIRSGLAVIDRDRSGAASLPSLESTVLRCELGQYGRRFRRDRELQGTIDWITSGRAHTGPERMRPPTSATSRRFQWMAALAF